MKILSVSALVCERLLQEEDRVPSAIRLADIFQLPTYSPPLPSALQVIDVSLLVVIKATETDESNHRVLVTMTRPDGEVTEMFSHEGVRFANFTPFAETPSGVSLGLRFHISAKILGVHFFKIFLNGELIATTAFTILEQAEELR